MTERTVAPPDAEKLFDKYSRGIRIIVEGAQTDTGQTPKEVVWTRNKAKLYHYQTEAEKKYRVPILLIYALFNRPYVLDLMPGNSFIEYLVNEGFDVYMLDWGIPGDEDRDMSFEDYVLEYMPRAVKKVLRTSRVEELTLFGYCQGGTMSAMYASLLPDGLKNLVLLATPIDCSPENVGLYGLWFDEKNHDPDVIVNTYGNLPAVFAYAGTSMLKPVTNYIGTYVTMWDLILRDGRMDSWLAMNKWANDPIPMPGAAYKQWIEDFYQQNKLVKGDIKLRGRRVDLSNVRCSLLNVAGKKDHLVLLPQTEAAMDVISSEDKAFLVLDAGHVGLLTGRGAKKTLWPQVKNWLEPRSK